MNHRDKALAAMSGQPVDHIPFIARMDLWYIFHHNRGTLPHPYEKASLWDIQRDLGVGIFGLGTPEVPYVRFHRLVPNGFDVETAIHDGVTVTCYHTPYGTLTCTDSMSAELADAAVAGGARTEFPFKTAGDFDALQFVIEHTQVVENMDEFGRFVEAIGTDGLAVPVTGHLPAHALMITYMGYQAFYYELHDHPARVEALIQALTAQWREIMALAVISPAHVVQVGGNYDEAMTPPRIFDRFFAPLYREVRQAFSAAGKRLVVHGDGEMRALLGRLADCGVEVVEALTPKPMTSIDVRTTRQLWKDRVTMWGGLATVILTDVFSDAEFEGFLEDLFHSVAPGDHFILGFGDNVPTDSSFDRVKRAVLFWADHGRYPLAG